MKRSATRSARRRGYVLFAVLLVTVVLSLTAYRFTDSMVTENAVAVRTTQQIQAKANAVSGLHYTAGLLAGKDILAGGLGYDPADNQSLFAGQPVGASGRNRFSIVNVSEAPNATGSGESRYPFRYGLVDESGKININALILKDPTGQVLNAALMTLTNQGMTQAIADSICNWVLPTASFPTGAGDGDYAGLQTPYLRKAGPLNTVEELLYVQGVTPQLLFGNDRNRNGKLDAGEDDGQDFNRGWSEYLTCYGREINVDSTGATRINLNNTDIKTLSDQLTTAVGQELSDYILYFRIAGSAVTYTPTLPATQVAAPPSQLRDLVQGEIEKGTMPKRKVNSVITVWNTQIPLAQPAPVPSANGGPPTRPPQPVVACPINDTASLNKMLSLLLDKCTAEDGYEIAPRINVNTAPLSVLTALPGVTPDDATNIVNARNNLDPTSPDSFTGAWLVTQAQMRPDIFKQLEPYIGGRSWTYRVHSVGYTGAGSSEPQTPSNTRGPVSRVEAVIDVANRTTDGEFLGLPRFVYFRDLTDLGRGFADLP